MTSRGSPFEILVNANGPPPEECTSVPPSQIAGRFRGVVPVSEGGDGGDYGSQEAA